ncbi:hypothetical protein MCGE09_00262 [Thaumarchaeota archaeon SCGC AB-539-E09]|nr:hypothetical protein MCGE09_00262 [Thaumarchaeota archaeon SCGC AB-539-E09]
MEWNRFQPANVERDIKRLFSVLGRVDKIPDKHGTYDFKIDDVKLLIEVTWISEEKNVIIYKELLDNEFFYKIRDKVEHVCKDHSNYPEYTYGGVISWDTRFNWRQVEGTHKNFKESFPFEYDINNYDWKYLVFLEEPRVPESDSPPAYIYLKEIRLIPLFQRVFENKLHVMYVLSNGNYVNMRARRSRLDNIIERM